MDQLYFNKNILSLKNIICFLKMQYALNQQQFHELVLKKIRNEKKKDQMPGIYYSIIYNNKKFQCISIGEYEINFRHCLEKTDIHIMTLIVLL